ncbi:MAG: IS481 family transposase [Gemmatimonadota bacterium]|nr:IS481 family transposase [Gemmatimonadota bacterium]
MNIHKNARLTPAMRQAVVRRIQAGESAPAVAATVGVSPRTIWKWVARARTEGLAGLGDRSSRPRRSPRQLPRYRRRQILRARHRRWSSLRIAHHYGLPLSTVVTVQRRLGLARLRSLEPPRPRHRYERRRAGALVHLDIKKLGKIGRVGHRIHGNRAVRVRGIGWEYVHNAIDDCSRVAYGEVLADERGATVAGFLQRAVAWYRAQGVAVRAVMTDNGSGYRSRDFRDARRALRLRHLRTRPYTPQTNGKVERFIRTLLAEWAYARAYRSSASRTAALPHYLHFYNTERPHTALGYIAPLQRLIARR